MIEEGIYNLVPLFKIKMAISNLVPLFVIKKKKGISTGSIYCTISIGEF